MLLRSVLGIINRDGTMAQYLALPAANCHIVPDSLTDQEVMVVDHGSMLQHHQYIVCWC